VQLSGSKEGFAVKMSSIILVLFLLTLPKSLFEV
jgi:hypothetical protein